MAVPISFFEPQIQRLSLPCDVILCMEVFSYDFCKVCYTLNVTVDSVLGRVSVSGDGRQLQWLSVMFRSHRLTVTLQLFLDLGPSLAGVPAHCKPNNCRGFGLSCCSFLFVLKNTVNNWLVLNWSQKFEPRCGFACNLPARVTAWSAVVCRFSSVWGVRAPP